ncbi:UDP-2-acetamido-2-deoxy-3-oxo-D-glucuronate aminotransferase [Dyadobacter sp. CECT 9275]|uniref:UDP-2-acetamido-2-deoxy-3-oxo-D-glucuronate aminotransferase n=1 Tax=Dyadobacter helix TaxID=2822344 RepID=A0A916NLA2_9BACT|nr:DegT/DnrJ/EryC1/StrS family aminotransferase [Dyadobacter sp. CECT 9275]CAG4999762.1 UDP-2-acetamido-2-deoxy-3-oxo-D-glucuronate aminotransferase [Dyadobacter sp. CECT 9275]
MNLAPLIDDTIQMVDLTGQYQRIKPEIDAAIQDCIDQAIFIKGGKVTQFENQLAQYLDIEQVISCGNGTDAIQLAFMALGLKPGDEVIVPAFTYAAAAEVIALLGLVPVLVDVDPLTFNMTAASVEGAITPKTRAVVPVHLFGQCADMENILNLCSSRELYIIEDNAQSLGAQYTFKAGKVVSAGGLGHLGITSFFPSKNLGCFGDGGAVYTNHPALGARVRMIANHGQEVKYRHDVIGINSRLDTIQAVILLEKLKFLNSYINARQQAASWYDAAFQDVAEIEIPGRTSYSTHVFHQYTLKVPAHQRDGLKAFLQQRNIPSMVYYPISLARQKAYQGVSRVVGDLNVTEELCQQVLSLPMHTELKPLQLEFITDSVRTFFEMAR